MDFTAPHFVLFESINDPFSGIIGRIFKHSDCPFEKVDVRTGDDIKSLGLFYLKNGWNFLMILGVPLGRLPALQFDGVTIAGFSPVCRSISTRMSLFFENDF